MNEKSRLLSDQAPLYLGHRSRLRKRFLIDNGESMPDYEMLELLLTMSIPRRDVKPLAKKLISEFGDLSGVVNAPLEKLLKFTRISENTATLIKIVKVCGLRSAGEKLGSRESNTFENWADFISYCRQKLAYERNEECIAFYFDAAGKFLYEDKLENGTINRTRVDARKIIQDVIYYNATSVILVHNYPSGDYKPSKEDIHMVEEIYYTLYKMNVILEDYLIVTREDVFSFDSAGYMPSGEISDMLRRNKLKKKPKNKILR